MMIGYIRYGRIHGTMKGKHVPWTGVFNIEYHPLIYVMYAFPAEKTSATQPFQAKIKVIPVQCIYKKGHFTRYSGSLFFHDIAGCRNSIRTGSTRPCSLCLVSAHKHSLETDPPPSITKCQLKF